MRALIAIGAAGLVALGCGRGTQDPGEGRAQVAVVSCLGTGYGVSCGVEVRGGVLPAGQARVQACVGDEGGQPKGLYDALAARAGAGSPASASPLWLRLESAGDGGRTCGVLFLGTGEQYRVLGFAR